MTALETRYWGSFFVVGLLCVILQYYSRNRTSDKTVVNARFASFQKNYLVVFLLAMFSDWLQGPYVYELYVSYGFNQQVRYACLKIYILVFDNHLLLYYP
jgi:hypothetical protein